MKVRADGRHPGAPGAFEFVDVALSSCGESAEVVPPHAEGECHGEESADNDDRGEGGVSGSESNRDDRFAERQDDDEPMPFGCPAEGSCHRPPREVRYTVMPSMATAASQRTI